jgi:uncharacterized membrane protein YdjX (TVP38/TMEM64 family)
MSAEYAAAAKGLALPVSPTGAHSPEREANPPSWSRRISSRARRSSPYSTYTNTSYRDQIFQSAEKVQRRVLSTFKKLTLLQRILVVCVLITCVVLGVLFLVYSERIFGALAPAAKKWRDVSGGWAILWALTFICAFPPIIGYSTAVTVCGFVYGFPNGWFIAATATVIGSLASFVASRTVLSKYVHRLVGGDKRFEALALTLKHDGLKILCMIRFCPLPYSLSNAAMSTFPTVHPVSFALATLVASPKLMIHVFIGSRLGDIAERGGTMDMSTRIINYCSIIFGVTLGATVGWIIFRKTMARARELEIEELEASRGELGEAGRRFGDGGSEDGDVAALMNDDDISLWGNEGNSFQDGFMDGSDEDVFGRSDVDVEAATKVANSG